MAVDVVWLPAAAPADTAPASEAAAVVSETAGTPADFPAERAVEIGDDTPRNEAAVVETPSPEPSIAPVVAADAPPDVQPRARPRETNETVPSRRRPQIVASRPTQFRSFESSSRRPPSVPMAAAPAEGTSAHQADDGPLRAAPAESASGTTNSVASGSEIVYRVAPTYPLVARRRGIEGVVILHVRYDASGQPEDISVMTSSGSAILDDAAREAVARWRFRGGAAGAVELPFSFRLAADGGAASSVQ